MVQKNYNSAKNCWDFFKRTNRFYESECEMGTVRIVMVTEWEWMWDRKEGRQTEEGGGVNGSVSSVQVSLLRVLCPNTLLFPYLLPLSSSADTACLDCRLSSLSPLISSFIITTPRPQLQFNCTATSAHRAYMPNLLSICILKGLAYCLLILTVLLCVL